MSSGPSLRRSTGPTVSPGTIGPRIAVRLPSGFRAVLGILRGAPIPRSASALRRIVGENNAGLYINYVRLARVVNGVRYYVFVSDGSVGGFPPASVSRCLASERTAFAAELPAIPTALQQAAKQVFAINLAADRRVDRRLVRESVSLFGLNAGGGGGGVAGATAADIRTHGMYGSSGSAQGAVLSGVVPDGVATVTFAYPRQRTTGPHRRWLVAATRTANVINNIVVTPIPRSAENASGFQQIWRDADGRVVRIVSPAG